MTPADQQQSPTSSAEAIGAWDGPLFERFVHYRHIVVAGLSGHGEWTLASVRRRNLNAPLRPAPVLAVSLKP
jgi:hypothetical protein